MTSCALATGATSCASRTSSRRRCSSIGCSSSSSRTPTRPRCIPTRDCACRRTAPSSCSPRLPPTYPARGDHRGRDVIDRVRGAIARTSTTSDHIDPRLRRGTRLTIDLGPPTAGPVVLLLTGWTDYAFSSDNVAAHQAGLTMPPPALQVRDAAGRWTTVIEDIGIPVGRPQTVAVDLTGRFLSATRDVRIVTSMRIYWDQVLVDTSGRALVMPGDDASRIGGAHGVAMTRLDPATADLRWRGFSAETSPDGREPYGYDYERVSTVSPWKLMPGRYTREGDVVELLARDRRHVRRLAPRRRDRAVVRRVGAAARSVRADAHVPALRRTASARKWTRDSASPDSAAAAAVPRHDGLSVPAARVVSRHARASRVSRAVQHARGRPDAGADRLVVEPMPASPAAPQPAGHGPRVR